MAGLSLGEYTALCAAGVFTFEDGLRLVKLRGEAMQEAATASKQGMLSVAGLDRATLEALCKEAAKSEEGGVCQLANALFPKGFACAGSEKAVNKLMELALAKGALQAKLLKTSGAFHTSLMKPAQEKLEKALQDLLPNMNPPSCTVYMNVTGEPLEAGTDPKKIVELLGKQLVSPVLWEPTMKAMIKDGISEFYECGPQKQHGEQLAPGAGPERIVELLGRQLTSTVLWEDIIRGMIKNGITDFYEWFWHYLGHWVDSLWTVHKHHHKYYNPTPFGTIADYPMDNFMRSLYTVVNYTVAMAVFGTYLDIDVLYISTGLPNAIYGMYLHCGHELTCLPYDSKIWNTSFQHYVHHAVSVKNKPLQRVNRARRSSELISTSGGDSSRGKSSGT